MNWKKFIYRAVIINGVFFTYWNLSELPDMTWWGAILIGVLFGFIVDYEERIKIKGADIYDSSDTSEYDLTDEFLEQKRRTRTTER